MKFFGSLETASFEARPNRFLVICRLDGRKVKAFLPNPGRLGELLFPGVEMYLEASSNPYRATPYTAVAVKSLKGPVMLHTHMTNRVARRLIEKGRVPGLEDTRIKRAEVTRGHSRFDFLLEGDGGDLYLEVKSCTLFSRRMAMFPDAVTARGRRHVEELTKLAESGVACAVLFLIQSAGIDCFLPDFHTDLEFARALHRARNAVRLIPLSVGWRDDLTLNPRSKLLPIPWEIYEREGEDRGCYFLLLRLERKRVLEVGRLGTVAFAPGYYVYVGSARANLSKRIERHRRLRKKMHWHVDYLRDAAEFVGALPVLTAEDLECDLARAMREIADGSVHRFGSSDCDCPSHLFHFRENPFETRPFQERLLDVRMDRLITAR